MNLKEEISKEKKKIGIGKGALSIPTVKLKQKHAEPFAC
jgi:hypothetical protein